MARGKKSAQPVLRKGLGNAAPAAQFDPKASRAKKLETAEDAFGGDEDDFHANRDQVLFESDRADSGRAMDELDIDDEIYALDLPSSASEPEDEFDDEVEYDEDDDAEEPVATHTRQLSPPRGRFAKSDDLTQDILSDVDSVASDADASSDEEETWAPNTYHASRRAPGEPDSEDDEALDMEADEARRLQKKSKQIMAGEDFGFGDAAEEEGELELARQASRAGGRLEDSTVVVEEDSVPTTNYKSEEEAIAFLFKKQPETLALLDDFVETAERMKNVEKALAVVRLGEDGKEHPALAIMELEHQAMSTYLPTLAFYFSLLLTPNPSPDLLARVMTRLTSLRSALVTMEELELTAGDIDDEDSSDEDDDDGKMLASQAFDMDQDANPFDEEEDEEDEYNSEDEEVTDTMLAGLADSELEELMKDMAGDSDADALIARVKQVQRAKLGLPPLEEEMEEVVEPKKKRGRKSKAEKRIEAREAAAAERGGHYTPKSNKNLLNLGPLLPPIASTRKSSSAAASTSRSNNEEDDFLDPISLSHTDLNDKAARKHTLRFHVSQVHQKSVKRESGGKQRIGGDDDLPRKSKEASRREVLKRQEHGGKGKTGEALDGMDWDEEDKREAQGASGGGDEGEDYYDLVKRETREGKVAKQVEYDDARGAEKAALDELTNADAAGPRGATRKIMANKGLQPKRAKVNRNPRVKKRLNYEKAVKKVASMKSVYKGGMATLGHGEYQGEKSGIGSKVVKSVRLGGK